MNELTGNQLKDHGRVLVYVLHCGNMYGTERIALSTVRLLSGYTKKFIVAPHVHESDSILERIAGSSVKGLSYDSQAQALLQILRLIGRYNSVDIISTVTTYNLCVDFVRRFFPWKSIRQLHVAHGGGADRFSYARKSRLNRTNVLIVAVSEFVKARLVKYGAREDRVRVIHNFLSEAEISAVAPRGSYDHLSEDLTGRRKVIVVSRISPIKRIDVLISALESGYLGEFDFDVYGLGEQLDALRNRTRYIDNIQFRGYSPNVLGEMRKADFYLHLCPEEPFGLSILEAMRLKLVVIVPDSGGPIEFVQEDSGFSYRNCSVESLVSTLRKAADTSAQKLDNIANRAEYQARVVYSERSGVGKYQDLFASIR